MKDEIVGRAELKLAGAVRALGRQRGDLQNWLCARGRKK